MIENYLVITGLSVFCLVCAVGGAKVLPGERWQFFASLPVRKLDDDSWEAVNVTWYGVILSAAAVFAVAVYLVMLGALGVPVSASMTLMAALLLVCVPASSLVARLVERKPATLTIGGAAFVGTLAAPFLVSLLNLTAFPFLGTGLPMGPALAACATAFLIGEGLGRLACLSYGCCYGRPVEEYRGLPRRIFERTALVFHGRTKKISYGSELEGRRVVPVQIMTMLASSLAGAVALSLFVSGRYSAAYLAASTFAGGWRILSELFRNDYRGEGNITAYQVMSAISILYAAAVAIILREPTSLVAVSLPRGILSLWSPGVLVILSGVWLTLVAYTGISTTTFSRVSFHLHRDKI